MQQKPSRWNVSPGLIAPEARGLWRGLAFLAPLWGHAGKGALLGASGQPLNGANLTGGSTATWRGTPYGAGGGITGASNFLYQDNFEPMLSSDGAGTGDFTIVMLANPVSENRLAHGLSLGYGDPLGATLGFNSAVGGGAAATGQFAFVTRDSAGTSGAVVAGGIDGLYHLFAGRRAGGAVTAWIDGISRTSTTSTVRDIADGTGGIAIGNRAESTAYRIDTATSIVLAAGWNRALSVAEMRLLARDPFAMLRPCPEWRGVWTPAGGAVLSPADLVDSFGFETPGFTQAHNFSAAGAALAESFEAAGFSQTHVLSSADAVLAEMLDAPGFSQAHLFVALEMNFALWFDLASLAMISQGAPGFRTRGIDESGRSENTGAEARRTEVAASSRSRTITE